MLRLIYQFDRMSPPPVTTSPAVPKAKEIIRQLKRFQALEIQSARLLGVGASAEQHRN